MSFMTASAWHAYDKISNTNDKFYFTKPLPGWRIEHVSTDGTISDYSLHRTRTAKCYHQARRPFQAPIAIETCEHCDCGYHLVRNVWDLLHYLDKWEVTSAYLKRMGQDPQRGLGQQQHKTNMATILARTHAYGTTERSFNETDPPETIRVTKTVMREVFLPTTHNGKPVPEHIAETISHRRVPRKAGNVG